MSAVIVTSLLEESLALVQFLNTKERVSFYCAWCDCVMSADWGSDLELNGHTFNIVYGRVK